jgi:hypothetical protein
MSENKQTEVKEHTIEELFAHVNAVEGELKDELNNIKLVLNKLVMNNLDKSE